MGDIPECVKRWRMMTDAERWAQYRARDEAAACLVWLATTPPAELCAPAEVVEAVRRLSEIPRGIDYVCTLLRADADPDDRYDRAALVLSLLASTTIRPIADVRREERAAVATQAAAMVARYAIALEDCGEERAADMLRGQVPAIRALGEEKP